MEVVVVKTRAVAFLDVLHKLVTTLHVLVSLFDQAQRQLFECLFLFGLRQPR